LPSRNEWLFIVSSAVFALRTISEGLTSHRSIPKVGGSNPPPATKESGSSDPGGVAPLTRIASSATKVIQA